MASTAESNKRDRVCGFWPRLLNVESRAFGDHGRGNPLSTVETGIRARYFLARNGGGRRSGENTLKLSDYFLQFGVYVASVASLVLKVIAQCAQPPDYTSQCLH
jgi:hypothetical protein